MTLPDARKILGLGPEEDPRLHLAEFKRAREHLAAMVRTAPNTTLAARYQDGLVEFDQALAAVQERMSSSATNPELVPIPNPAKTAVLGITPAATQSPVVETTEAPPHPRSRALSYLLWCFVLFVGVGGGAWIYLKNEDAEEGRRLLRIAFLERQGAVFVENRRWQDAVNSFAEIEELAPGSDLAMRGRHSIEAGIGEEQTQFIGYWNGQATAELEAGRLDEADAAARQVLAKHPNDSEAVAILQKVAAARVGQSLARKVVSAREFLDQRKWNDAISTAREILVISPENADAQGILAFSESGVSVKRERIVR